MKKNLFIVFAFEHLDRMNEFLKTNDPDLGIRKLVACDRRYIEVLDVDDCDHIFLNSVGTKFKYYVVVSLSGDFSIFEHSIFSAS